MSLKGKRIVVTGASKGLGLGVVRRLCAEGANILAHYNSGDIRQARACAEEAGVEFESFQADLSNIDEVLAMAERINAYEDVYGLVNNAGICLFEDFFAITKESYDKTFDINMKAVFFLTQKITEKMVERGIHGTFRLCDAGTLRRGKRRGEQLHAYGG